MKAKNFEKQFNEDVDITALLDVSKAKRVLQDKVWLAERLEKAAATYPSSGTR